MNRKPSQPPKPAAKQKTDWSNVADWYDTLAQDKNVFWVENGDAQGFFDLLTQRLGLLK